MGEAQCVHAGIQGVPLADNTREYEEYKGIISGSLHKDLCLRISGLVDS